MLCKDIRVGDMKNSEECMLAIKYIREDSSNYLGNLMDWHLGNRNNMNAIARQKIERLEKKAIRLDSGRKVRRGRS